MKKKHIIKTFLICTIASLSFTACGKKNNTTKQTTTENTVTVTPSPTPTPTPTPDPKPDPIKIDGNFCYLSNVDKGLIINSHINEGIMESTNIVYELGDSILCIQATPKVVNGKIENVSFCTNYDSNNKSPLNYISIEKNDIFTQLFSFSVESSIIHEDDPSGESIYIKYNLSVRVNEDSFELMYGSNKYILNLNGEVDDELFNQVSKQSTPVGDGFTCSFRDDVLYFESSNYSYQYTFKDNNIEFLNDLIKSGLKHEDNGDINFYIANKNITNEYELSQQMVLEFDGNKVKKLSVIDTSIGGYEYNYSYEASGSNTLVSIIRTEIGPTIIHNLSSHNPIKNVLTLDNHNRIIRKDSYKSNGSEIIFDSYNEYKYYDNGNLKKAIYGKTDPISCNEYYYNSKNLLSDKRLYNYSSEGSLEFEEKEIYAYDGNGDLIEYEFLNKDGNISKKLSKKYSEDQGVNIYKKEYYTYSDEDVDQLTSYTEIKYNPSTKETTKMDLSYEYSSLASKYYLSHAVTQKYIEYNQNLKISSEDIMFFYNGRLSSKDTKEYTLIDSIAKLTKSELIYYDDLDNLTYSIVIEYLNNADLDKYEIEHEKTKLTIDSNNNVLSRENTLSNFDSELNYIDRTTKTYDENNDLIKEVIETPNTDGALYVSQEKIYSKETDGEGYFVETTKITTYSSPDEVDSNNTYKEINKSKTNETINEYYSWISDDFRITSMESIITTNVITRIYMTKEYTGSVCTYKETNTYEDNILALCEKVTYNTVGFFVSIIEEEYIIINNDNQLAKVTTTTYNYNEKTKTIEIDYYTDEDNNIYNFKIRIETAVYSNEGNLDILSYNEIINNESNTIIKETTKTYEYDELEGNTVTVEINYYTDDDNIYSNPIKSEEKVYEDSEEGTLISSYTYIYNSSYELIKCYSYDTDPRFDNEYVNIETTYNENGVSSEIISNDSINETWNYYYNDGNIDHIERFYTDDNYNDVHYEDSIIIEIGDDDFIIVPKVRYEYNDDKTILWKKYEYSNYDSEGRYRTVIVTTYDTSNGDILERYKYNYTYSTLYNFVEIYDTKGNNEIEKCVDYAYYDGNGVCTELREIIVDEITQYVTAVTKYINISKTESEAYELDCEDITHYDQYWDDEENYNVISGSYAYMDIEYFDDIKR